jgi:diguanylate cyclase (GGDEF)-like protein
MSPPDRRAPAVAPAIPRALVALTVVIAVAAIGAALAAVLLSDAPAFPLDGKFWLLALFVLIGELLPIQVPRRHSLDRVTVSTAFAFAILLRYGLVAAMVVYAVTSFVADLTQRIGPTKALFNCGQYAVSLAAAAGVLSLAGAGVPVEVVGDHLPAILLAAIAFFVCNQTLAGTGAGLLLREPLPRYLADDIVFQAWTAGFLLALGPIVVVSTDASLLLAPVSFIPMMAIYFGGREAVMNAHRARHDLLTELPNRTLIEERLNGELADARRERGECGVIIVDLDNFKAVNDTLGHHWGDLLLEQMAPRLSTALRHGDLLGRLGGDEFAVVVPGGVDACTALAERLVEELKRPFVLDSVTVDVAASIGIACYPDHGTKPAELFQHADVALYAAKASPDRWRVYDAAEDNHTVDRLALAAQLRSGIDRGEIVLHYQPKFALDTGAIAGVEVLVRWRHPHLGLILPDGFIPLAEQTGVIKPLTLTMMDRALAQCRAWRDEGLDVRFSLNVSPAGLLDHELPDTIAGLLVRHGLPPTSLQLEVTESRPIAETPEARAVLDKLRGMGVSIAIDDFGTGFSSLAQLQRLPVDEIKIDRSFVRDMEHDSQDAAIVRSTIDLGRNLGLRVTAEGVESESVRRALLELGCDYAQGFHLGLPLPADEAVAVVRAAAPAPQLQPAVVAIR